MILSFFSSHGWECWDVAHRPVIPEQMPVLVDDDLRFEGGPGASRPAVAVNRWLRGLPVSGRPAPSSWASYARVVKAWMEFLTEYGVGLSAQRYATVITNAATGERIDVLADRSADTLWAGRRVRCWPRWTPSAPAPRNSVRPRSRHSGSTLTTTSSPASPGSVKPPAPDCSPRSETIVTGSPTHPG